MGIVQQIDHRAFATGPGAGARPAAPPRARPSSEREPWRLLRSSLAIRFTSRAGDWSPERLAAPVKADLLAALEARWETHLAYAQLQAAVYDLRWAARDVPELGDRLWKLAPDAAIAEQLRVAALKSGPLRSRGNELLQAAHWLAASQADLDRFCRGWIEVVESRSGAIEIRFQGGWRRAKLSCAEVRARAEAYSSELSRWTGVVGSAAQLIGDA